MLAKYSTSSEFVILNNKNELGKTELNPLVAEASNLY